MIEEWKEFFWRSEGYWIWPETRLLILVAVAGALGALLHVMRSLFWYVGNRNLRWSWILMYVLTPFTGGLISFVFYFILRGGFFPVAKAEEGNPISFTALALLIGLFSAQASEKLKEVFEIVFKPPQKGANDTPPKPPATPPTGASAPAPTISVIMPNSGDKTTPVTIDGSNFLKGATVRFGTQPATSVTFESSSKLRAIPPDQPPQTSVDIVVTNPDNQSATMKGVFKYT
jgi:hypothetical protein